MQIISTRDAPDWNHGQMSGAWLNYDTFASPVTGFPALVPLSAGTLTPVVHNGGTLLSSAYATANGGHAWTVHNRYLTTDQANDYLQVIPPSNTLYLDVVTTNALYPDMVDTHSMVWDAYVDGDAAQNTTVGPLYVEQLRHGPIIKITVDGVQTLQVDTDAVGLKTTRVQLDGLSSHTVQIINTGAVSTPTTDVHRLSVVGLVSTAGSGGAARLWTSPIFDAGDPDSVWVGADWEQAAGGSVAAVTVSVGQTPQPDASWLTYSVPVISTVPGPAGPVPFTIEGVPHGRASFLAPAGVIMRGRYAEVTLQLVAALPTPAANGSTVPWVRSLDVYTSVPESETLTILRLPPGFRGPLLTAAASAKGAVYARLHADAAELVASYSIGTARGRWLQQYGRDQNLPQAPGEGQVAYAARLQAELAGRALGPSAQFVAQTLSAYIGGAVVVSSYGSAGSPFAYTLTIPPAWSNPVSRAQIATFAASINIAGMIATLTYSS